MSIEFQRIQKLCAYLAKEYAPDVLRLLYLYKDISASEAASRLSMHIRTVQDFMEALHEIGVLKKEEVYEKKRPYFRYKLENNKIAFELDIATLADKQDESENKKMYIRERKNANVRFTTARNNLFFSNVSIWIGDGRNRSEKKVSLTKAQGMFLFNLPFPDANFSTPEEIMKKACIPAEHHSEIIDIVNLLIEHEVIEAEKTE